jgi:hypothetical protein
MATKPPPPAAGEPAIGIPYYPAEVQGQQYYYARPNPYAAGMPPPNAIYAGAPKGIPLQPTMFARAVPLPGLWRRRRHLRSVSSCLAVLPWPFLRIAPCCSGIVRKKNRSPWLLVQFEWTYGSDSSDLEVVRMERCKIVACAVRWYGLICSVADLSGIMNKKLTFSYH